MLFGHVPFTISVLLFLFVIGVFVYLAVRMSKKKDSETVDSRKKTLGEYEAGFVVLAVLVSAFFGVFVYRHFYHRSNLEK